MISYNHNKAVISVVKTTNRGSIRKTLLDDEGYKIKTLYFETYPFSVDVTEVENPEVALRELVEWGNGNIYRHRGSLASPLSHVVSSLSTTGCYTCGL